MDFKPYLRVESGHSDQLTWVLVNNADGLAAPSSAAYAPIIVVAGRQFELG